MNEACDLAVALRANANVVAGLGAIRLNGETLIARHHQLHGTPQALGRQRRQRGPWRHLPLRTESTADIRTDDVDLLRFDAEPLRNARAQAIDELAWLVDRELAVAPGTGRREQLERIVMLR